MEAYAPGDQIYVFGFSRGAYTARALTGMLYVFGIFRPGSETLVPYAVHAFAGQHDRPREDDNATCKAKRSSSRGSGSMPRLVPSTVRPTWTCGSWACGTPSRRLGRSDVSCAGRSRASSHTRTRSAMQYRSTRSADQFAAYLVQPPNPDHIKVTGGRDLVEVWFAESTRTSGACSLRAPGSRTSP